MSVPAQPINGEAGKALPARGAEPRALPATVSLANASISTYAGNGTYILGEDGWPAADAGFVAPNQAALDGSGNLYIADTGHNRIRKVNSVTGVISIVAGIGTAGFAGDGGPAQQAELDLPQSVAFDSVGNMYIADYGNRRVRKVDASGQISTVAGNGSAGEGPTGQPAAASVLNGPYAIAFDTQGNYYIDDSASNCVWKVTIATGILTPYAGKVQVFGSFGGDGGLATEARMSTPYGIAFDPAGNLLISDTGNNRMRRVDAATGLISTIYGTGSAGFAGDGGPGASAEFSGATWLAFDAGGNLYIADTSNDRIRWIDAKTGFVSTIAGSGVAGFSGDGGLAISAELNAPSAIAVDPSGTLYVADSSNGRIRAIRPASLISSSTSLVATPPVLQAGESLSLTATVTTADSGSATGTVTFSQGALQLGTATVDSEGVASLDFTPTPGSHGITATYEGSTTIAPSFSSLPVQVTVNGISTSTSITASASTLTAGQSLKLKATVTAASGDIPTGSVTFASGTTSLGTVQLDAVGNSQLTLWPAAGSYSVTASYGGNNVDDGSVSPSIGITVTKGTNTTPYIYTFAGDGTDSFSGDGGPAVNAGVSLPAGLRVDEAGHVFVGNGPQGQDNHVRMIDASTGIITTVAGNGLAGYSGDGGPATSAALNNPFDVALDRKGNLYIADAWNACVRRVDAKSQIITTAAGVCGSLGISGDGGPATKALFILPVALAFDAADDLYVSDAQWGSVRKIDAKTGIINTVAGVGGVVPTGDGGPATAACIGAPYGLAVDSANNLYIVDWFNAQIRKVDGATGIITTVAGTGKQGYSGDGGPAVDAQLYQPSSITLGASGNLFFSDSAYGLIRTIDVKTGIITRFAGGGGSLGDGGPALDAYLAYPAGVAFDRGGNLYIGDSLNHRVRVVGAPPVAALTPTTTKLKASATSLIAGQSLTLTATVTAASGGTPTGTVRFLNGPALLGSGTLSASGVATLTITPVVGAYFITASYGGSSSDQASVSSAIAVTVNGPGNSPNIYTFAGNGIRGFEGDGGSALDAELDSPMDAVKDTAGNLFITDSNNHVIRRVDSKTGVITTVAGTGQFGFSGDGGPATQARLSSPMGTAIDASGNLYIADWGNSVVRRVDAVTGIITTIAGTGSPGATGTGIPALQASIGPYGIVIDSSRNLYLDDLGNSCVWKLTAATGIIDRIAGNLSGGFSGDGGPAASATLNKPLAVGIDSARNVYIADTVNQRVRRVDSATGVITTIAGTGTAGSTGDGGPAISADLDWPSGVAFDAGGNLFISTFNACAVRRFDSASGFISSYAGDETCGFSGDSGPANLARMTNPTNLSTDGAGNLFIADLNNSRIRVVGAPPVFSEIATTTKLKASATSLTAGQTLTLTATVTAASGPVPTGKVTFLAGSNSLGSASLDAGGLATLTFTPPARIYSLTASYGGSAADDSSQSSPPLKVTVTSATTTMLQVSATSLTAGQALTLTATVTAASGPVPTGTVTFMNGSNALGSASLNTSGAAALTITPAVGVYSITAEYGVSATDAASTSSPPIAVTVMLAATSTQLKASPNPAGFGMTVALQATATSSAGTPTGTATFYDGAAELGKVALSSGSATVNVSTLGVGSHNLTAAYGGDAGHGPSTSSIVVEVITPADFSISAAPAARTLYTGESASYTVTITPKNGFSLPVTLSCPQLPANTTCVFSPTTLDGGRGTSNLTVQTSAPAQAARALPSWKGMGASALAGLVFLCLGRARRRMSFLLMLMVIVAVAVSGGCSAPRALTGGTPVGSQTVAISATAQNAPRGWSHTTTVTLKVKSLF